MGGIYPTKCDKTIVMIPNLLFAYFLILAFCAIMKIHKIGMLWGTFDNEYMRYDKRLSICAV